MSDDDRRNLSRKGTKDLEVPVGYAAVLTKLKQRIREAQIRATMRVSRELLELHWAIGHEVVARQEIEGWGNAIIEKLAADLQREFPGVQGFSARNIWRMRAFFLAYRPPAPILPQAVAELPAPPFPDDLPSLPWGHHLTLIEQVKDPVQRTWYAQRAHTHGWSRSILEHQIDTNLFTRQGAATTNFAATLPPPASDLARELIKDPYNFEFLALAADAQERELERGLLQHMRDFLLELGAGFAFVGSQYHLVVGGEDFYLDLLFYHLKLRRFVVIDLKVREFAPEHAGKMNFYLSVVDDQLRHTGDERSIGIVLCKSKDDIIAEYALRDVGKPMGVSTYRTTTAIPAELRQNLPRLEDLQAVARAEHVRAQLATLSPPEEKLLRMKFGLGQAALSEDGIAEALRLTVDEVHERLEAALRKLRSRTSSSNTDD